VADPALFEAGDSHADPALAITAELADDVAVAAAVHYVAVRPEVVVALAVVAAPARRDLAALWAEYWAHLRSKIVCRLFGATILRFAQALIF
jgi:hypothetical protein